MAKSLEIQLALLAKDLTHSVSIQYSQYLELKEKSLDRIPHEDSFKKELDKLVSKLNEFNEKHTSKKSPEKQAILDEERGALIKFLKRYIGFIETLNENEVKSFEQNILSLYMEGLFRSSQSIILAILEDAIAGNNNTLEIELLSDTFKHSQQLFIDPNNIDALEKLGQTNQRLLSLTKNNERKQMFISRLMALTAVFCLLCGSLFPINLLLAKGIYEGAMKVREGTSKEQGMEMLHGFTDKLVAEIQDRNKDARPSTDSTSSESSDEEEIEESLQTKTKRPTLDTLKENLIKLSASIENIGKNLIVDQSQKQKENKSASEVKLFKHVRQVNSRQESLYPIAQQIQKEVANIIATQSNNQLPKELISVLSSILRYTNTILKSPEVKERLMKELSALMPMLKEMDSKYDTLSTQVEKFIKKAGPIQKTRPKP